MYKKNCVICGKEIISNHKHKIMCSPECRRKRINEKQKLRKQGVLLKTKTCPVCQSEFKTDFDRIIYCSSGCRDEKVLAERKFPNIGKGNIGPNKSTQYERFCKYCRKIFKTKNKFAKYCSTSCGRKKIEEKKQEEFDKLMKKYHGGKK